MGVARMDVVSGPASTVRDGGTLRLLRQETVVGLLGPHAGGLNRFEASGVTLAAGRLLVIFDNLPHIASLDLDLTPGGGRLVVRPDRAVGYEDVAHDAGTGRVFAVIEAARDSDGEWRPQIDELAGLDVDLDRPDGVDVPAYGRLVRRSWVDVIVRRRNKGIEGLTCVRRHGAPHLLALEEDTGRIVVLREGVDGWDVVGRLELPPDLHVEDYAGLSVQADAQGDRIAVVSQQSSTLWVGRLDPDSWRVCDAGHRHRFPTDSRGRVVYGTVEGVCWLDESTVVAVSDIPKKGEPDELFATAASVHVFELPATAG